MKADLDEGGAAMANRSANVIARVEPSVKEQAEEILMQLGIPVSTVINMLYREIILWKGLPFRPSLPIAGAKAYDELTKEEFDSMMEIGLAQAKANQSAPVDEVFDRLIGEIQNAGV